MFTDYDRQGQEDMRKLQHHKQRRSILYSNSATTPTHVALSPHKLHASILHIAGRLACSLLSLDDCHRARCVRQHVVGHTSQEDPAATARLESRKKMKQANNFLGYICMHQVLSTIKAFTSLHQKERKAMYNTGSVRYQQMQ